MNLATLFHGEDYISVRATHNADLNALTAAFRRSGLWEEVVRGVSDLTAKYDPMQMPSDAAEAHFRRLWTCAKSDGLPGIETAFFHTRFELAPDLDSVATRLGMDPASFPRWLCTRSYQVTMMGFQPGFAYLEDIDGVDIPTLPRLDTPRQHVVAGSIGFLGKRACIYALDGPGGWPIVGRVKQPLFNRDAATPILLQPGQLVRFGEA